MISRDFVLNSRDISDCNWARTQNHLVLKRRLNHLAKLVHLTVCSCHVTYAYQSESTLYSCLDVKELIGQRRILRSLSNIYDGSSLRKKDVALRL